MVTAKLLGGSHSSGRVAKTSTPDGSSPVSSWASRRAAAVGEASVSSMDPPGKETWPGWERMSWARSVSRRSGPAGPSPKSISTAPLRAPAPSGGTNLLMSSAVIVLAPSRMGSSQAGRVIRPSLRAALRRS